MRVVFMGTPDFAVPSLKLLTESAIEVAGVVTAPDRKAGRGLKLRQSAVKQYAVEQGLPVLQPEKLRNPAFLEELKGLRADLFVVVAFRMLPEMVWNMPPKGSINLHASLLPQYRGAAPINWAVINGETETGLTTFFLKHEIDTGNILFQDKEPIHEDDTAGTLHDRLMERGAQLVLKTVQAIASGEYTEQPQPEESGQLKKAPKIFREDCKINWHQPVEVIYNFIRGLSPFPTAFTELDGKVFKIYFAEKLYIDHQYEPGTFTTDEGNNRILIAAQDGYLVPTMVQLEGKKRMPVEEFMLGYRF